MIGATSASIDFTIWGMSCVRDRAFVSWNDVDQYALQWTTNRIQWFVDGNLYQTQTNWSTATAPYPAPFDQPFYIIMNLAVGGDYGGNPDSTTRFPGELQVDYVRVYDHIKP